MPVREWLRRPGHLLVAFLVLTLLPACALALLGWRLFQQDVALEAQHLQDRLENAADRVVATLDLQLDRLDAALSVAGVLPPGDDIVRVAFTAGRVEATPAGRLLYYPPTRPDSSPPRAPFFQGEALEFGSRRSAATAVFRQLAGSSDATIRAGALLRLARTLRNSDRREEALVVYEQLASLDDASVETGPAGLVGQRARSDLLLALGRREESQAAARGVLADLHAGRWRLDRATYEFHARDIAGRFVLDCAGPASPGPRMGQASPTSPRASCGSFPRLAASRPRSKTGLEGARMGRIDWSPNGGTIAFDATRGGEHELWLMEDFLHLVKPR